MVRVTFNGVEYSFKLNLAVLMSVEAATAAIGEKAVTPFRSAVMTIYACLLQDESFTMSYEDFLACIDTDEEFERLNNALLEEQARWAAKNDLTGSSPTCDDKKKE